MALLIQNPSGQGGSGVTDGNKTGILVSNGAATWVVVDGHITNARLAAVATGILKGRTSAGAGVVEDLNATQVRSMLGISNVANLAPADLGISNATATALAGKAVALPETEGALANANPVNVVLGGLPRQIAITPAAGDKVRLEQFDGQTYELLYEFTTPGVALVYHVPGRDAFPPQAVRITRIAGSSTASRYLVMKGAA